MESIPEHDRFKNFKGFVIPEWKKNGTFIHELGGFYLEGDFWGQLIFTVGCSKRPCCRCNCIGFTLDSMGKALGPME